MYSPSIDRVHFGLLQEMIPKHLEDFKDCFNTEFTPKQHNMTHIPASISMAGPLVHMSTLKFETKHKEFSSFIRKKPNFINVSKSLAQGYKTKDFNNCFQNQIETGKSVRLKIDEIHKNLFNNFDLSKTYELNSLKFNSYYYKKGLFLKDGNSFYRIEKVLLFESEYYFLCTEFTGILFDEFLNSLNIKESIPKTVRLLCLSKMSYKKSHTERRIGNSLYIISESIEI